MLAAIARLILWWIASGALTVGSYFQMSLGCATTTSQTSSLAAPRS